MPPDDRNAFRFLWWTDSDLDQEPVDHRIGVHLFGVTSSPSCCNFALRRTAEDNKGSFVEEMVNTVKKNLYVNDCFKSVKSSERAVEFVDLTKWLCNKPEVIESIAKVERAPSVLDLELNKERLPVQRTLGLKWDMESDKFTFEVSLKDKPNTSRGILSLTSSVYHPLGFLAPIVFPAKKCCKISADRNLVGTTQSAIVSAKGGRSGKSSCPASRR